MFAVLLTSCSSKKNDLEKYNLKGKVWKVNEITYEGVEKFGKYQIEDKNYYGHQSYIFNEDGNLIELRQFDRNKKIKSVSKNTYDKSGNCIEITTYEDNKIVEKRLNQIENDKIVEAQVFDKNGKLSFKYEYNYSGVDISGGKVFNSDGSLDMTFQNEFSGGLLNKQIIKDSLEEITSVRYFERNKEGDIVNQKVKYPKDTTEYTYSFQYDYDEKGNWFKKYQFNEEDKINSILVRNIIYYGESNVSKTDKDFIGMWFVVYDNDWIELRSGKKYDAGYKDRIRETGTWEVDSKQQVVTFRANNPDDSRKYKYNFEGDQIILFTIQGEEKLRLEKR